MKDMTTGLIALADAMTMSIITMDTDIIMSMDMMKENIMTGTATGKHTIMNMGKRSITAGMTSIATMGNIAMNMIRGIIMNMGNITIMGMDITMRTRYSPVGD